MFAARFDPTKIFTVVEETTKNEKIVPLKRSRSIEPESEDESEQESEQESEHESKKESEQDSENDEELESSEEESADVEVKSDAEGEGDDDDRHNSVLSRFHQTISLQDKFRPEDLADIADINHTTKVIVEDENSHPLEQIPQPEIVKNSELVKTTHNDRNNIAWINTQKVYYDTTMTKPFQTYEDQLTKSLLKNIQTNFSAETFPIQSILLDSVLPTLNRSVSLTKNNFTRRVGDLLINASTGSGKTLAYSVPIIQTFSNRTVNKLRTLVIVPTKLLILQVYDTLSKLSKGTGLIITISKFDNSLKEEHRKLQQSEPDIFITTPGRLVDHLQMNSISLKNLKFLILDEADRLLNQSFQNWCSELMNKINTDKLDKMPGNVIKMVFSATLTTNTQKLHDLQLYNPRLFITKSVKLYNLPVTLQEFNICIPTAKSSFKPLFLLHLLHSKNFNSRVLVFVKSNEASLRLAKLLSLIIEGQHKQSEINVESINSNNSKAQNRKLLNDFSADSTDKLNVLITTDIMSRGIDINNITEVINYDTPISSQQYVHRCGRTARAGNNGNAYNYLVGKGERKFWNRNVNNDISRDVGGLEPKFWMKPNEVQDEEGDIDLVNDDTTEQYEMIVNVSEAEDTVYKEALGNLKEEVLSK